MADNDQHLKHGKALCGKVFGRFVETFNALVDFMLGIKGDADGKNGEGHITYDRKNNIIRCDGCGGSGGGGGGVPFNSAPSPFEFTLVTSEPEEGEEEDPTGTPTIVNNTFYWDGVLKSLSDFTPPATCTVYLCCTQAAPSSSAPNPEWQFSMATSPAQAPSGGRVVNYKIYDIESNKITMDYRTTFLELNSPHEKARIVVKKPSESNDEIELDATSGAKVKVKSGTKSATIDPSKMENGNAAGFHTLTVKHADGTPDDEYDVIADKDITIYEGAAQECLTGVELELNGDTNLRLKLTFTDKDGNTRDEYSTGITLKQVDVVSNVSWSSPTLSKSEKTLTVIEESSGGDEDVFTAEPHSANT